MLLYLLYVSMFISVLVLCSTFQYRLSKFWIKLDPTKNTTLVCHKEEQLLKSHFFVFCCKTYQRILLNFCITFARRN